MRSEGSRTLRGVKLLGWVSLLLAVVSAGLILRGYSLARARLEKQSLLGRQLRLGSAREMLEEYWRDVRTFLFAISLEPGMVDPGPADEDHLWAHFLANSGRNRCEQLCIVARSEDGAARVVLSLRRSTPPGSAPSATMPSDEALTTVIERHLALLAGQADAEACLLDTIACPDRSALIVQSVPVIRDGWTRGAVVGVLTDAQLTNILRIEGPDLDLVLVGPGGAVFTGSRTPAAVRDWFVRQSPEAGNQATLPPSTIAFEVAGRPALASELALPGGSGWHLAVVAAASADAQQSLLSRLVGWIGAALVLAVGGTMLFLCRTTAAMIAAREQADCRKCELVQSEQRFRVIAEAVPLPIVISRRADGRILYANRAVQDMFGITPAVARQCSTLGFYAQPSDRTALLEQVDRDGQCAAHELVLCRADGSPFNAAVSLSLVHYAGEPALLSAFLDVTARVRAEDQARQHQAELARASRVGTIGGMTTGLAHELNQPLAAIVNYVQACIERLHAGQCDPAELLDDLHRAAAQAERAGGILEHIRAFVRKHEPRRMPMDLNALVRGAVSLTGPEARRMGVEFALDLHESLGEVVIDPVQVEQVIVNLVRNALDSLAAGDRPHRQVRVRTDLEGNCARVTVADNGAGLAPQAHPRLFEPFFTTKPEGMGLGLSICRTIIEGHGGRIWADSEPQGGAAFAFTVPLGNGVKRDES